MLIRHLLVLAPFVAGLSTARAADVVTEPYEGVRHIARTTSTPNRIHAVEIDLTNPRIRIRATKSADRGSVVTKFADRYGCQVATNGDFFAVETYTARGLAIGHGEPWPGTKDPDDRGFVAFGVDNHVEISSPSTVLPEPEPWMSDVIGGRQIVVRGGVPEVRDPCTGFCARNPRTAVGISEDGTKLILAVVDGRSTRSLGMSLNELGVLMEDLGAHRALNLDGGGSTTMVIKNEGGVLNTPSDGAQRVVANHLGICIVEPFGTLRGVVRAAATELVLPGVPVTLSTGATVTTDEAGAFELADVPRGEVTISVDVAGYAPAAVPIYVTADDVTTAAIDLLDPAAIPASDGGTAVDEGGALGGACAAAPGRTRSAPVGLLVLLLIARRRRAG